MAYRSVLTRPILVLAVLVGAFGCRRAERPAPQPQPAPAPVLRVAADPASAAEGSPIRFTASIEPPTRTLGYEWSFHEQAGTPDVYSSGPSVTFAFHALGVQHAQVRAVLVDTNTIVAKVPVFIFNRSVPEGVNGARQ